MEMENKSGLKKSLHRFRIIGIAEGVSFLVLLLIAMPIKYIFKIPEVVKVVGWLHGGLFVAYILFAFEVFSKFNKSFLWLLKSFTASIIPAGTFMMDKQLRKEENEL
jgi:integral membrane protein